VLISSSSSGLSLSAGINTIDESASVVTVDPPTTVVSGSTPTNVQLTKTNTQNDTLDDSLLYDNIFDIVAGRAATCLVESDLRRDAKEGYSKVISSSATNWINDATAFQLQKAFDKVKLKVTRTMETTFGQIGPIVFSLMLIV